MKDQWGKYKLSTLLKYWCAKHGHDFIGEVDRETGKIIDRGLYGVCSRCGKIKYKPSLLEQYFERKALASLHEGIKFYPKALGPLPECSGNKVTFNAWKPLSNVP